MESANIPILKAVANSGTVVSAEVNSKFLLNATVQARFSDASAAGTLKLQASNDPTSPTRWNDIANSSVAVTGGATSITPSLPNALCYQFIRVAFVSSAGAGTITANLNTLGA